MSRAGAGVLVLLLAGCASESRWCDLLPREQFRTLERVTVADDWFEVYRVGDGVLALYEPWQFQEVISYLILGREQALLFDTDARDPWTLAATAAVLMLVAVAAATVPARRGTRIAPVQALRVP